MCNTDPVDSAFDLTPVGRFTTPAFRIISAYQVTDTAVIVFNDFFAGNIVSKSQTNFASNAEPEEFFRRVFHKIILFYIYLAREGNLPGAIVRVLRMINTGDHLGLLFRIILDNDF